MATIYLRSSDGDDADDGSTWALAKATLASALTAAGDGGLVWVDDDHSESFGAATTFTGGTTSIISVVVVTTDTTTPVSSPTAAAQISTTTSSDDIRNNGKFYFYGFHFDAYRSITTSLAVSEVIYENCHLEYATGTSGTLSVTSDGGFVHVIDCLIEGRSILSSRFTSMKIEGGSYVLRGTAPTSFVSWDTEAGTVLIEGFDLSGFTGTDIIRSNPAQTVGNFRCELSNCKMPTSYTLTSSSQSTVSAYRVFPYAAHASDNADGYYKLNEQYSPGSIVEETTIKRQGGATYDGTNEYSLKFASNSSALEAVRFYGRKIWAKSVDISTSTTFTVHIAYDSATVLNDDDAWIVVKYHDATDQALAKFERTNNIPGVTPTRTPFTDVSGAETWDGTGGWSNPNEETIEASVTGAEGLVEVFFYLSKPSVTVYVDLQVEVS